MKQEGIAMVSGDYWSLFLQTGAPEAYLLYAQEKKTQGRENVSA